MSSTLEYAVFCHGTCVYVCVSVFCVMGEGMQLQPNVHGLTANSLQSSCVLACLCAVRMFQIVYESSHVQFN